ncbi:hypothetical protein L5515_018027 [Caenorhabditis briggsae]|uniref:Uncharacterized protein n=2 Tax=Caenorhabditis briggsae TaxID=6238 RepID=A0AAE9JRR1_CAEBR|nr:hypothetical protein L5515_018027 [Caenorhabditis briggsae]
MVISTGPFITGRIGELDLIRAGWIFMHRTMSVEDTQRFEQMINTPAFCVKKFEEMFLLRRINPFAPTEDQRIMVFSHADCACKNAQDAREISEMKKQLEEFLAKWETVFKQLPSASPEVLLEIGDLKQQTTEQLNKMENVESTKEKTEEDDTKTEETKANKVVETAQNTVETTEEKVKEVTAVKENNVWEKRIKEKDAKINKVKTNETKTDKVEEKNKQPVVLKSASLPPKKVEKVTHHGNAVAEQCVWNVAHVSGKPTQPKPQQEQHQSQPKRVCEVFTPSKPPPKIVKPIITQVIVSKQPKQAPEATNAIVESRILEKHITVACAEQKIDTPMTVCTDISPAITEHSRSAGTPDSGMISDISEVKAAESEVDNVEKEAPVKQLVGRDARRYRQKLREAEKAALADVVKEETSDDVAQDGSLKENVESEVAEPENTVPTGKERRRLKDKMRKEKKELEKLVGKLEESTKGSKVKTATEAVTFAKFTVTETKTPETTERKEATPEATETNAPEPSKTKKAKKAKKIIESTEAIVNKDKAAQKAGKTPVEEFDVVPEDPDVSKPKKSTQNLAERDEKEIVETSADDQVQKLSKSQKRRVNKKVSQGTYVVNDNGDHSIELLPGEYKIVQLDQDRNIQEIDITGEKEDNVDQKTDEKKQVDKPKKKKLQNFYVAGNLSKEILDNGKWLAYVIDEKKPGSIPKFGEVSTEEVAETIKLLDSQMAVKNATQPDGYVDDLDYNCTKNSRHVTTTIKQIMPELDANLVRENFAKLIENVEPGCYAGPTQEEFDTQPDSSDLQLFIESNPDGFKFHTEFARRTSSLFLGNQEFRDFCVKYSNSKYGGNVISSLIKKYIDTRIVYHYERFKKLADREAHRIAKCWTRVTDNTSYALMVMLFINNPTSNVGFDDIERVLFPPRA